MSWSETITTLQNALGPEQVLDDEDVRIGLSMDISPPDNLAIAGLVVQAKSPEDVKIVVQTAAKSGASVSVRGGGMSYTGGYQVSHNDTILLDLSHLSSVVSIYEEDRFMVVEAGCTWQSVQDALDHSGLRSQLRGPISGDISTVGGAASQNLPGSMDSILGIEVVTSQGELVRTGSLGAYEGYGFYRNFGPDLTGLFLGDCGTLGVKTKVALRLEPAPSGMAFGSYAFDTMQDIAAAMTRVSQNGLSVRTYGLDPLKNKTATKVDTREGLDTLKKIVTTSSKGLLGGLVDATKVATAGKKAFDHVPWSMHVTTEGVDQVSADSLKREIDSICLERGRSIEPSIPMAMAAKPYSIRGVLGIKGERWVPLMGVFPFSKVKKAVEETERFFDRHSGSLLDLGIIHSFMMSSGDGYMLIESMFYWPDTFLPLHREALGVERIKKFGVRKANPKARALVSQLRTELRDLYFDLGAVFAQAGKFYRFKEAMQPSTIGLIENIKECVDSRHLLSPGNLGLGHRK